jgi:hypothetical protein
MEKEMNCTLFDAKSYAIKNWWCVKGTEAVSGSDGVVEHLQVSLKYTVPAEQRAVLRNGGEKGSWDCLRRSRDV